MNTFLTFIYISILNLHSSSYVSYCGMNYANIIGFFLFNIFIIQFFSGILLVSYFNNIFILSFDSVIYIMIEILYGFMLSWFHCLFSSLFIFYIYMHIFRALWLRILVFDSISFTYYTGIIIFIMGILNSFLGYILNFGQMSYWGYMVLLGLVGIFGILYWMIIDMLWCCCYVVVFSILLLHFVIGWLIIIFIIFHVLVLHGFGSVNPMLNNLSSYIISFYIVLFNDICLSLFCIYSFFILLFFHPDILGNADNLILANPLVTPDHIVPEAYFMFIFYLLRSFHVNLCGIACVGFYILFIIY